MGNAIHTISQHYLTVDSSHLSGLVLYRIHFQKYDGNDMTVLKLLGMCHVPDTMSVLYKFHLILFSQLAKTGTSFISILQTRKLRFSLSHLACQQAAR